MQPLEKTSISSIQARLHNLFNSLGSTGFDNLPLAGDKLTIEPMPPWENTNAGQPLDLVIGEEWCQVILNKRRWISILPNPVPGFTPQTLPEQMQNVILRKHCEGVVSIVGQQIGLPIYWPDWAPQGEDRSSHDHVSIAFKVYRNDELMGAVELSIPSEGTAIKNIARWVHRSISAPDSTHGQQVVACHFSCGELSLNQQELMGIEIGDILFPPADSTPWRLCLAGHTIARLAQTNRGWELASIGLIESSDDVYGDKDMDNTSANHGAGTNRLDWDRVSSLNVSLRFELGDKQLTIGELQQLKPGMVITSDIDMSQPVLIYQGDALFGRGILMDVGGRLGIQVTSLAAGHRKPHGRQSMSHEVGYD